jgi:hypothetical protein
MDLCCVSTVTSLTKIRSDHFPLLFEFQITNVSHACQFKFMKMWSLHPDCSDLISDCWNTLVVGCPMVILSQKLKNLKAKLKVWNKEKFGNVHDLVSNAELKLQQIQALIQAIGHTDALLLEEKLVGASYEDALNKQEAFWQERARLNWHLEGDRNTKYFHRLAKIKTSTKFINSLQDGDTVITNQDQIAEHVVNYYNNLFCTNIVLQDSLLAEEVIPNLVNDDINSLLTVLPSNSEIKAAVFALNKDSAPGPDGFGAFSFNTIGTLLRMMLLMLFYNFFSTS